MVPVQRVGALMLQKPHQCVTQPHPCLSFSTNPAPIHAPCEDEGAGWEHEAEQREEFAQRICSQPPSLWWVCGGIGGTSIPRALGLRRLSEEQHASEEPFLLSTPPQQAELPTHGQELPALPPCKHPPGSSTLYPAPRTPTKLLDKCSPALLVVNLSHDCSPRLPSPAMHAAA